MKCKQRNGLKDVIYVNDATYIDYLERLKKIALSIFEWVNLPKSMDARYLERTLYYRGQAGLLFDDTYGFINTSCANADYLNIYGLPIGVNCYSFEYHSFRKVYNGLRTQDDKNNDDCILVQNTWDSVATANTLELFAMRLYEAERACDTNIKLQKMPWLILTDENQRMTMQNVVMQIDSNKPAIYGDKNSISHDSIQVLNLNAPFVANDLQEYKRHIWNEALTFLGVNNISGEKKERMITGEASENNELINLNLQSYLAPRQRACEQFNERYGLTGDKAISVKIRSDLHNILKDVESVVADYTDDFVTEKVSEMQGMPKLDEKEPQEEKDKLQKENKR